MMKIIVIISSFCLYVSMFEVSFEKAELLYFNKKYYNYYDFTLRRANRKSPYVFNLYQDLKYPLGNNLSYKWAVYEIISGREILTPIQFVMYLCDSFKNDQFLGHLFSKQIPRWVCPMPAGPNNWTNIELTFTDFPYMPFTYASQIVRTLTTIDGYINKELVHRGKAYTVVKQKLQDKSKKINVTTRY